nr:hypothetical protein DBT45_05495 [Aerococcus tenax]
MIDFNQLLHLRVNCAFRRTWLTLLISFPQAILLNWIELYSKIYKLKDFFYSHKKESHPQGVTLWIKIVIIFKIFF